MPRNEFTWPDERGVPVTPNDRDETHRLGKLSARLAALEKILHALTHSQGPHRPSEQQYEEVANEILRIQQALHPPKPPEEVEK